jgi:hypothetical protein
MLVLISTPSDAIISDVLLANCFGGISQAALAKRIVFSIRLSFAFLVRSGPY